MIRKKIVNYVVGFIISLLVFLVLLVTSIELVAYDQDFYIQQYQRLNTAENIGMTEEDLIRVTQQLIDYISGRWNSIESITAEINGVQRQVFNEREITHMVDVKRLFELAAKVRFFTLMGITVLTVILYFSSNRNPLKYLTASYLSAAGLLLLTLIVSVLLIRSDFTYYWDQFHYIFFSNDLWILNPETDIMIQMVPEPFFYQAVFRVFAYFGTGTVIISLGSCLLLKLQKRLNNKN